MERLRATKLLAACTPLAARIAASGRGVLYTPAAEDWEVLHGFAEVWIAFGDDEQALLFEDLRALAGLRPSDMGLLRGVLDQYYLRFPGVVEARIAAVARRLTEGSNG